MFIREGVQCIIMTRKDDHSQVCSLSLYIVQ